MKKNSRNRHRSYRSLPFDQRPQFNSRQYIRCGQVIAAKYRQTNIASSRHLERKAQRNVQLMWLCERLSPNHKTIRPKLKPPSHQETDVFIAALGVTVTEEHRTQNRFDADKNASGIQQIVEIDIVFIVKNISAL